jgi:hypothetical protein
VKRAAVPLLVILSGCGFPGPTRAIPDYDRPWNVLLTEYSVPVVLGLARPGSVGGWEEGPTLKGFVQGWTHRPAAHDVDNAFVNLVLHPLSGSETHMLARRHGWTFGEAVLFDAAGSFLWEYVFENMFERPSRIDLLVTAPLGCLLGELRWLLREEGILTWLVDPLGSHGEPFFELAPEGLLFGVESRF